MRNLFNFLFVFVLLESAQASAALQNPSQDIMELQTLDASSPNAKALLRDLYETCESAKSESACNELAQHQLCKWREYRNNKRRVDGFILQWKWPPFKRGFVTAVFDKDPHCATDMTLRGRADWLVLHSVGIVGSLIGGLAATGKACDSMGTSRLKWSLLAVTMMGSLFYSYYNIYLYVAIDRLLMNIHNEAIGTAEAIRLEELS